MANDLVAVLDIGKSNAKVVVADPETGAERYTAARANAPLADTPYRALDAAAIEAFLLDALKRCPLKERIGTIVPVGHGAAAALVKGDGLALPVLDYEEPQLDAVAEAYRAERAAFAETLSPFLPLGLNLGRQFFFLEARFPEAFAAARTALLWPQYVTWRLTGTATSEVTSLGCHTDLWEPARGRFSKLALRRGWAEKFPALVPAGATIGTLRPALARETGLSPRTRVLAGIHDSNASFLCHRAGRESGEPFTVLSSGTWTIILANGGALDALDESRDCLANVDAYGEPTASARFMGGREYAAIAGDAAVAPTRADLNAALARGAMALPSFAEAGGPFPGRRGRLVDAGGLAPGERAALASLYLALMSDVSLNLLSSRGPIAVEGPLAKNTLFGGLLAALRQDQPVHLSEDAAGTVGGALRLAGPAPPARSVPPATPLDDDRLGAYRDLWRARAEERGPWSM